MKYVNAETDLLNTTSGGAGIKGHNSEILRPIVTTHPSCWK